MRLTDYVRPVMAGIAAICLLWFIGGAFVSTFTDISPATQGGSWLSVGAGLLMVIVAFLGWRAYDRYTG